jgi:iron(III) transport system ATP-binding protein
MAEVRLIHISKSYEKHQVIKDLSITIQDGECLSFLGPSGSGKTVVLRMIAGFEQPDRGEISIGDHLVASTQKHIAVPPELRRIGVVFQDYAVWPHKTVMNNVIYPLAIQKTPKKEAVGRVMQTIKQVGMDELENRYPYQLSGGQQQRVALARALVSKPEIMLLDEPLSNLDANLREEMRFEIKDLQKNNGITILYVTHDQEVALAISDRIAIFDQNGSIRQVGTPDEIYEKPVDSYVFRFVGIANFLPVSVANGKAIVKGTDIYIGPAPSGLSNFEKMVAGMRPMDIEPVKAETPIRATIQRVTLLGPIIDYRVKIGDHELRIQQETQEAVNNNLSYSEGDICFLRLHNLKWFDSQSLETEVGL